MCGCEPSALDSADVVTTFQGVFRSVLTAQWAADLNPPNANVDV